MLNTIDLFSGTGGLAYALRGLCTTVAYVEIAPDAQTCLRANIRRGYLDDAPLYDDVRTFDATPFKGRVDLVAFGSPCVGFSSLGPRTGLDHDQSSLFFQAIRIVRECEPSLIVMENVHTILSNGIDRVVRTLDKAGYDCAWSCGKAWEVGAPQIRHRWFLTGFRRGSDIIGRTLTLDIANYTMHDWSAEPVQRMVVPTAPTQKAAVARRISLVGNGVVPDCVRACVFSLLAGHEHPVNNLLSTSSLTVQMPKATRALPDPTLQTRTVRVGLKHARVIDGTWSATHRPIMPFTEAPNLELTLVPRPDVRAKQEATSGLLREPCVKALWATPRYSNIGVCRVLTRRSCTDIGTQLRFERDTPDDLRDGVPSPEWIEWLQGLPHGFSAFS